MLHMPQGLPNQTVMGASGAYARKTHTTMCHLKQQTHLMQNIKSANMFQTHTSGQCFTLLVNPSHFWSITSGRFCPCHACNFWSILHTSNQSVTLLPVTSGQSLNTSGVNSAQVNPDQDAIRELDSVLAQQKVARHQFGARSAWKAHPRHSRKEKRYYLDQSKGWDLRSQLDHSWKVERGI